MRTVQASVEAARGPGWQAGRQICCQTEQIVGPQVELATGVGHPAGLGGLILRCEVLVGTAEAVHQKQ